MLGRLLCVEMGDIVPDYTFLHPNGFLFLANIKMNDKPF